MVQESIDSFLYNILSIQNTTFSFNYHFYSEFFSICFLQFFLIKSSSNFFTIYITNKTRSWNSIFNFANNNNFLWPIWGISFSKNVVLFRNSDMITYFKFGNFFIRVNIVFSIRILCNISQFHFNNSMNCVIVFF